MREYTRQWRARNPERAAEGDRKQSQNRRAQRTIRSRERYAQDPEKYRAMQRRSYAKNEKTREARYRANRLRRARKQAAQPDGPIDYITVVKRCGMVCHICGKSVRKADLSFDHLIPLARGGPHVDWNISVAHRACNSSKGARYSTPAQMPLL
jgi:5-methylcytosine-specific restriction endonuclease McrA